ncbi:MAG: hypothetical protein GX254_03375 [Clostridiales bacterium]|jgi:chromosome segregation ATPase|nr:hypothetical protein [Clostridiales bacterium]
MNTQYKLRGKIFGGFNRQDVVNYIEKNARLTSEYKASKEALEVRCDELAGRLEEEKAQNEALRAELASSNEKTAGLYARITELEKELSSMREAISSKDEEINTLTRQISSCNETIDEYENSKERIALLELNASRRAVDIEKEAENKAAVLTKKCNELINTLKTEYIAVCNDAEATVAHITNEMDKIGAKLCDITELLSEKTAKFDELNKLVARSLED